MCFAVYYYSTATIDLVQCFELTNIFQPHLSDQIPIPMTELTPAAPPTVYSPPPTPPPRIKPLNRPLPTHPHKRRPNDDLSSSDA